MYQQVMEAIAVFDSHNNSGYSASFEINLVKKLCSFDIITPLRFTNDEWLQVSSNGTYQNKRNSGIFKNPNGSINYIHAFIKRPTGRYSHTTKEWTENKNPICWYGVLFEHKDNVLTGRYFIKCNLFYQDITNGWIPKETKLIDCVEVEIDSNNWITAVDADSTDLLDLSRNYYICWKHCPCLKGVSLEDVTSKLVEKAYNEIKKD